MDHPTRRQFLNGAAILTAGALVGCSSGGSNLSPSASLADPTGQPLKFHGTHQSGILGPFPLAGATLGLDVRVEGRAALAGLFRKISETASDLMAGAAPHGRPGGFPAVDTGILGPNPEAASVVVGVGASLFDDRFGLRDQQPRELQPMPKFVNDYLVRDERSHGDISVVVEGATSEVVIHAVRQILRETRGDVVPKWIRHGFNRVEPDANPGGAEGRNLMGFKDGTSNLRVDDNDALTRHVWVGPDDDEPEWAIGGSYQAIRVIRMMVEFWDRTRLNEQEAIFGRHRDSGAPLGMDNETDVPDFGGDLTSHIARANPRTPGSERSSMLRRGMNYADGLDQNDQLDQGLIFVSYQRSIEDGFITVQRRLDGEVLEEYIRPLGGGIFFALPGPAEGEYLGQGLFEA